MDNFSYSHLDGPVETDKLDESIGSGNCRLAVQHYFCKTHNIKLQPDDALCPKLYQETGEFVIKSSKLNSFDELIGGEIIFAERVRSKSGKTLDKSRKNYKNEEDWSIDLHTAIFLGPDIAKPIWHATIIEGETCYWTIEKFLEYYKPVAAKRIKK